MILNKKELAELADVITEVEKKTSGELRLILAKRSSTFAHVFPMLSLMLACAALVYLWSSRHYLLLGDTTWLLPMVLLAALGLGFLFSRLPSVQRQLSWGPDLARRAEMRAELEFYREGLGNTDSKTGILIFLSLLERQAVVLADKGIASKLKPEIWREVIDLVVTGAKKKRLREHLEKAIRLCGDLLAKDFPIQPGDKNELPNRVLVKD